MHFRLHADYECYPLWIVGDDGLKNVDPQSVESVPATLAQRINKWGEIYDATYVPDDPAESGFDTAADKKAFDEAGEKLWQELRAALGDQHRVEYFSVVRGWMGR